MMSRHPTTDSLRPAIPWAWGVLGLLCGLSLALIAFAPAHWLAPALARASNGHVRMQAERGTVWDGSAQLVITGGQGSRDAVALPSPMVWTVRPAPGGLALRIESPCCTRAPLVLALHPRYEDGALGWRITVANGTGSEWPAALLAGLGTPWNTLHLEGQLQLTTRDLAVQRIGQGLQMTGQVEVQALGMSSRLAALRPLGSYRIHLEGGPVPTLQVSTLDGDLQLTGTGQWVQSRLLFSGQASTSPEREAALSNLLNLLGRREGARSIITLG